MLDHPWDLEADFRRFYGLDPAEVSAERFLALAYRVAAYGGVMTNRAERSRPRARTQRPDVNWVENSRAAILADPLLREVVSIGRG